MCDFTGDCICSDAELARLRSEVENNRYEWERERDSVQQSLRSLENEISQLRSLLTNLQRS